jgi:hypothetical protein
MLLILLEWSCWQPPFVLSKSLTGASHPGQNPAGQILKERATSDPGILGNWKREMRRGLSVRQTIPSWFQVSYGRNQGAREIGGGDGTKGTGVQAHALSDSEQAQLFQNSVCAATGSSSVAELFFTFPTAVSTRHVRICSASNGRSKSSGGLPASSRRSQRS